MKRILISMTIIVFLLSGCIYRPIPGSEVINEANDIKLPEFPLTIETNEDYGTLVLESFKITSTLPSTGEETHYSANYELTLTSSDIAKTELGFDFAFYNNEGFKIGWYSFKEPVTKVGEITIKANIKIPNDTVEIRFGKTTQ